MGKCKAGGCKARAWNGDLCNYHALLDARARRDDARGESTDTRVREVRDRAAELGITLDEVEVEVAASAISKKVRSPMS